MKTKPIIRDKFDVLLLPPRQRKLMFVALKVASGTPLNRRERRVAKRRTK